MSASTHRVVLFVLGALVLAVGRDARADDDVAGAAKAFAQAQEVMLAGDVARAADLFELADELSPSAPALRNATRARFQVHHHAMAATHAAELLRRYPSDKESRSVAEAILTKLTPQLAQLEITCTESCTLEVDGKAIAARRRELFSFFTQPGERSLVAVFADGRRATDKLTALVNHITRARLEPPPKAPEAAPQLAPAPLTTSIETRPPEAKGLSRGWFVAAAVVTVGLGAGATLFGVQTLKTRDQVRDSVETGASDSSELYDKGRDQQLRTNVLLGATAAAGVATIVIAVFTNWSGAASASGRDVGFVPAHGGGTLVYGARC
ncbi:MAG: hypothetical protein WKG01_21275 [Kofleriaceae bacterium]